MSDHNEAPSTEDEIEDVISEAKKKAAKAQNPNKSGKSKKNRNRNKNKNKTKAQDEESSENLFNEIDSVADSDDDDENLSPKQRSAKEYSKAFAAAKEKREKNLSSKKTSGEVSDDEEEEEEAFEIDDEEYEEDSEEFEVDSEDEEYEDDEEYDGIFETDDENEEYIENVDIDDDEDDFDDEDDEEDDDEDYDEEDDDEDDESTFSTKAKVIIGIIIAILVLAIIGAGLFFLNRNDEPNPQTIVSQQPDGSVTGIQFKEPAVSLRVGETIPLEIIVEPEDAEDKVLRLKSNDATIAKVDEAGNLTGVSSGSTTVTATLKSNETITASLIVNVIDNDQDAINVYNKFVNALVDGSTDIDSDTETDTDTDEQQYDEFGNPIESTDTDSDSDSDSDSDNQKTVVVKDVLTGNIIKDLDSDGELELALLYKDEQDNSNVRFFRLADPNEEEKEEEEPQYDEYGNLIETEDTDSEAETDTEKSEETAPLDKVLTEVEEFTELYSTYYTTIETDGASWNTSYIEIKEEESELAKVTILSSGYESPSYTYESEDETIAKVDNQGNIKAIKPGTTYVTVSSPLNSDAVAKIKVRVKDDTDLLDDYLAQIPVVNATNDVIFPTETLTGKAIVDIDNDGVSELLLRFDYGNDVQAIEMIKVENEKCVAYKTYNNLSDLYEYSEGKGSYSNSILVHYTTGKVCMEYRAVVAKEDSKTRTTEQKILSVESGGGLSELVNFKTTTDITTKTVTSEVVVEEEEEEESTISYEDTTSEEEDTDSETSWYGDEEDTDSEDESYTGYDDEDNDDDYYYGSYAQFTFDELEDAESSGGIDLSSKKAAKKLPEAAAAPDDDEDGDEDSDDDDTSSVAANDNDDDEPSTTGRVTSTVTSEVSEETTKYFVNGTPVEQSVYEETLSTYAARYSVWSAWESVNS